MLSFHATSAILLFPSAPDKSVSNLNAKRTPDDQTLVVTWDIADLQLPLGPVALYEVEYRDVQQSVSTTAHVQPGASFLVIRNITNVNKYEVRQHVCVHVHVCTTVIRQTRNVHKTRTLCYGT